MNFKKIEIRDFDTLRGALENYREGICDFSAGNLVFWRDYYDTSFYLAEDGFAIRFGDIDGEVGYWCGDNEELAKRIIVREGGHAHFCCLSEREKSFFEQKFNCRDVIFSDDWNDYIYNSEEIRSLTGKKFSGQRNHINKFKKLYPDYSFSEITEKDVPDIIDFTSRYFDSLHYEDKELAEYEEKYIAELMSELDACPQRSGVLRVEGKVVAFSVGEIVGDQLIIHIEKADTSYLGAYPMIVQLFAKLHATSVRFINREEDCGVPGLRTSKLSYHPCSLIRKYSMIVSL